MGGGAEGWYWYEGAVGMVCEVELDGDIEAISVLGNIMRIKVKGVNNMQKVSLRGRYERRRCLVGKIWECYVILGIRLKDFKGMESVEGKNCGLCIGSERSGRGVIAFEGGSFTRAGGVTEWCVWRRRGAVIWFMRGESS